MKLGQRDANKKALECAVAIIEKQDLFALFGEDYLFADNEDDQACRETVLEKAKNNAVRKIAALAGGR